MLYIKDLCGVYQRTREPFSLRPVSSAVISSGVGPRSCRPPPPRRPSGSSSPAWSTKCSAVCSSTTASGAGLAGDVPRLDQSQLEFTP